MPKYNGKRIIIVIAVIGLLIFLHWLKILGPLETGIGRAFNPVFSGFYNLGAYLRTAYSRQTSQENLEEKVAGLTAQVNQLTVENARLEIMADENETLRQHLDFLTAGKFNYVMANIISRENPVDLSEITESVIIDKGSRDGLYPGLAVVSSEGVIIGKIAEVKETISRADLTNSGDCKIAAAILNGGQTAGIAEGDMGLTIKMSFIPQDVTVNVGDVVVTSGLEQAIPRGLVLGRVIESNKENNELWQSATLEPIADPNTITIVSVILP